MDATPQNATATLQLPCAEGEGWTQCRWLPYGNSGAGNYTANFTVQHQLMTACLPAALQTLDHVTKVGDGAFVICDFGCADGGISLPFMNKCIENVKAKYGQSQEVLIIYEDLPTNDYKSLIGQVQGGLGGGHAACSVFVAATWTGFYQQTVPTNTLHLGFSSTAFHWLQTRPCPLKDAFIHLLSNSEEEKAAFRQQARRDWDSLLLHRASELAPGGRLFLVTLGVTEAGLYNCKPFPDKPSLHEVLTRTLNNLTAQHTLTQEECSDMTMDIYLRTRAECEEPFLRPHSPVLRAGLRLLHCDTLIVPDPSRLKWNQTLTKDVGAAREYARELCEQLRKFTYSTIYLGLSPERSKEQRRDLTETIYRACEDVVAEEPAHYGLDAVAITLEIAKISGNA